MVSTGATSVSHAASVYHPHLLPPSSVAYPGISPIRLAEASPPPHSMPIEQSQYHRRCERVSPIRFKLTGAALHLGVTAATHVRRAAKLKTLCISHTILRIIKPATCPMARGVRLQTPHYRETA